MHIRFFTVLFITLALSSSLSGCAISSLSSSYTGPESRPDELLTYYSSGDSYSAFTQKVHETGSDLEIKKIVLQSKNGMIDIDFYSHKDRRDDLVFVFPMLGGRNELAKHFALYLSTFGVDAAIIHRNNDFKNPEKFDSFEENVRRDAIQSRIAIDFFENEYGKKDFGTFGISRGAISAAISAGIDSRLKYNVFALGGSDIAGLFRDSDEGKIRRYVTKASLSKGITEEQFYFTFDEQIRTDPKYLAKHIDARNTLMILGLFDSTVPYRYGSQLRADIGNPKTIYLPTGHRTSGLYTQYVSLVPPTVEPGIGFFPFDYLESETLDFYRKSFKHNRFDLKLSIMRILNAPINLIVDLFD